MNKKREEKVEEGGASPFADILLSKGYYLDAD